VFNVTSYNEGNGNLFTIIGDGSGNPVVLDFASASNILLAGDVALAGCQGCLTDDQVLWNFTSSGHNIALNTGTSSFPLPLAFHGIILAPNDTVSVTNANLDGRVWGGDGSAMQIGMRSTINAPVPEPKSLLLTGLTTVLIAFIASRTKCVGPAVSLVQFPHSLPDGRQR
jgi:hypothetical protein